MRARRFAVRATWAYQAHPNFLLYSYIRQTDTAAETGRREGSAGLAVSLVALRRPWAGLTAGRESGELAVTSR